MKHEKALQSKREKYHPFHTPTIINMRLTFLISTTLLLVLKQSNSFSSHSTTTVLKKSPSILFHPPNNYIKQSRNIVEWRLLMSGNDDGDEEDDEDDEYDDLDVASFRQKMESMMGGDDNKEDEDDDEEEEENQEEESKKSFSSIDDLISFASSSSDTATTSSTTKEEETTFAKETDILSAGCILIANPYKFCNDLGSVPFMNKKPSSTLLSKFGLSLPPPSDLGPDRRADLLPVLILVPPDTTSTASNSNTKESHYSLLLNRRTGYLIGDLEEQIQQQKLLGSDYQPESSSYRLGAFMIQPLWFGGTSPSPNPSSMGIEMIHLCTNVQSSMQITTDGVYYGGDPAQAQEAMKITTPSSEENNTPPMTGFDFKFFVQSTKWAPGQLEKEIKDDVWFVANVSKDVLFKSRDRLGSRRAKPLWTEVMELLGGRYKTICEDLYNN